MWGLTGERAMRGILGGLACAVGGFTPCLALASPTIINLGVLPNFTASRATAVSGDGTTVVGSAYPTATALTGALAFRWTLGGGMQSLGTQSGFQESRAFDVNADGTVVVGSSTAPPNSRGFRWTAGTLEPLPPGPGVFPTVAFAVSADGRTIAASSGGSNLMRWTSDGGSQALPLPQGASAAVFTDMSDSGSSAVGWGVNALDFSYGAFVWSVTQGTRWIEPLAGWGDSRAEGISGDGRVVVGYGGPANSTTLGFRWTAESGMILLGGADGSVFPYATSGDGTVIVGRSETHAFLWTELSGVVNLNTYLPSVGVDVTGWNLTEATGVSANGSSISGTGTYYGQTRAFLITGLEVPSPSSLAGVCCGGLCCRRRKRPAST